MTKKEFDKLTKENWGSRPEYEHRHILRTKRGRPSAGTTALASIKYKDKRYT